jgi:peroxiredoxin
MRRFRICAAIAIAALSAGSGRNLEAAQFEGCSVEDKIANYDFELKDMNGGDVRLSDYEGKVILLDFWATWCAPCKIEIPGFIELYDKYRDQGFEVVGISVDDPVDALRDFAMQLNMNYPVLVGDGRDDVKEAFGPLIGFPTTFIIGRDGTVCSEHVGFAPKAQFEAEIQSLL